MKFAYFDPKTGQPLFDTVEGVSEQRWKESEHSFLEHWLDKHKLPKDDFWVGVAYQSDHAGEIDTTLEQQRLEAEGKHLIFTNGKDGYFASQEIAQLMSEGDPARGIGPIFANNRNSPHNFVAYGSLVASDGIAEVSLGDEPASEAGHSISLGSADKPVRLLVIDDENRSHGDGPLRDRHGQALSAQDLSKLYDKMGDGTMLVSTSVMGSLVRDEEREQLMAQAMKKAGVSEDLTDLTDTGRVEQAIADGERRIDRFAGRLVSQFRAASTDPDLPGIAKGTLQSSRWAERLGVDAIISTNDIKGDDGKFSTPGIHEVSDFWINRKSDAQYSTQSVGPQVKGTIPEATLHESNPRMQDRAEKLAAVASDPKQLLDYYVQKKEHQQRLQAEDGLGDRPDWIYDAAKADPHGVLTGFSKLNRGLEKFLRRERVDVATHGISVPSAMAQHHSQLKPWEVANKDLPQGAIVSYYRSPFPNVGAAAIAINNPAAIKEADPEAFHKHGVAYLNPHTAKNVAITDFDSDANGYFVGYLPSDDTEGLADSVRAQLAHTESLPPSEQYEAGRSLFAGLIEQSVSEPENSPIRAATAEEGYPLAVKEFVERNAPEVKPAEIKKAKKIKHPWDEGESRESATYRAWQVTANNPTGKVANAGMTLQSLAAQTQYVPEEKREALMHRISNHFKGVQKDVAKGKLSLPTNVELDDQGFPPYHLEARVNSLADASRDLSMIKGVDDRRDFIQDKLDETHSLLTDIVDGPVAVNLQTAVDVAKSARGINEDIHRLAKRLAYQEDHLRESHKDHRIYTNGKEMPSNIDDPINWAVGSANQLYRDSQIEELPNESFKGVFPKDYTAKQEQRAIPIAKQYNALNAQAAAARERMRGKADRDNQPTLLVQTSDGRQLQVEKILESDPSQKLPIWRSDAEQHSGDKIALHKVGSGKEQRINAVLERDGTRYDLCPISPESVKEHQLDRRVRPGHSMTIANPSLTIQPAYSIQNPVDELFERASEYLDQSIDAIPEEERMAYASAMWRDSHAMGPVLKRMIPELSERLEQPIPDITVTGLRFYEKENGPLESGDYKVRFDEMSYESKGGTKTSPSVVLLLDDGAETQLGALNPRDIRPRQGTVAIAHIERDEKGKTATLSLQQLETDRGWVKNGEQLPEEAATSEKHQQFGLDESSHYSTGSFVDNGSYYQPTLHEVVKWAVNADTAGNAAEFQFAAQVEGALLNHAQQSGITLPELDYSTPDVTINAVKFEAMHDLERQEYEATRTMDEESRYQRYKPSAGDLRQWSSDAGGQGDMESATTFEALESQLSQQYQDAGGVGEEAPDYYRHPSVTVPIEDADRLLVPAQLEEQEAIAPYEPTIGEVRRWYTEAKDQGNTANQNAAMGLGQQLNEQFVESGGTGKAPDDYHHSLVSLTSSELSQFQPLSSKQEAVVHEPTRRELLDWHKAAIAQEDTQKADRIKSLGHLQAKSYRGSGSPPDDYHHSSVGLSPEEFSQMREDMAAHQQPTSLPSEKSGLSATR